MLAPLSGIYDSIAISGEAPVNIAPGLNRNERVKSIYVQAAWIGNGFVAGLLSIITGLTTANPVTHWWVEIETERSWYCAQFDNPDLVLVKCRSEEKATETGLRAGVKKGGSYTRDKNITTKYRWYPSNRTIGDVEDFIRQYAKRGKYDLVNNNCQDFGKCLYQWI